MQLARARVRLWRGVWVDPARKLLLRVLREAKLVGDVHLLTSRKLGRCPPATAERDGLEPGGKPRGKPIYTDLRDHTVVPSKIKMGSIWHLGSLKCEPRGRRR